MNAYVDPALIEKWYKLLKFPKKYDAEFYDALNNIKIRKDVSVYTYDLKSTDGKKKRQRRWAWETESKSAWKGTGCHSASRQA